MTSIFFFFSSDAPQRFRGSYGGIIYEPRFQNTLGMPTLIESLIAKVGKFVCNAKRSRYLHRSPTVGHILKINPVMWRSTKKQFLPTPS